MESVEHVAEVVLYEGYLLYPYTRSALKNQQRWTFGGVYPRAYSEATGGFDPWLMQTQCLLRGQSDTTLHVKVRFLHVIRRTVSALVDGALQPVAELRVGERVYRPWEESVERTVLVGGPPNSLTLTSLLQGTMRVPIEVPAGRAVEPLVDEERRQVGALVREWKDLSGEIEVGSERLDVDGYRLTVRIVNAAPNSALVEGEWRREDALLQTFVSTHTILHMDGGEFVSLLEPPPEFAAAAEACDNIKTWPVLAGARGSTDTVLSSPIILYDYPEVAPETPGDLFDATEIDELLRLSVMTLTDREKQEMRETDPRVRDILDRTESLSAEELMKLHATVRSLQSLRSEGV